MDRQIVYPGSIPLDTDILNFERSAMIALGYLAQATLGIGMVADGLACTPTVPASMTVNVGPGSITQYGVVDAQAFGSLPADSADPLLTMGINIKSTQFTLTAPTGSGLATNFIIEASFLSADTTPIVLPYYNAANPGMPYSGPNNSGEQQNTQRLQRVQLQMKAGAPSAAGTQISPNVDSGWVGLYTIVVFSGQSAISAANIVPMAGAPFIPFKLQQLSPGTSRATLFTPANQGSWTVPAGVSNVKLRLWGGGGSGGPGFGGAGGGGAGGGYSEGFYGVAAGEVFPIIVGNGGAGAGTNGSASSFGNMASAAGGTAGSGGASGIGGSGATAGGHGAGVGLLVAGQGGGSAYLAGTIWVSGRGGASFSGSGGESVVAAATSNADGYNATIPGCGGSGGVGGGLGGQGGPGLLIVEY